jgi:hypothetical protein
MSNDDSGRPVLEPGEVDSFSQHLEEVEMESVGTGSPLELRRSPDGGLVRHLSGASSTFRPAAMKFSPMTEEVVDKLVHDLQDFAQRADFAVFVPDDAASELMEDDSYSLPMIADVGSYDERYVSKVWGQESLGRILESKGFSRLSDYLEGEMFDKGRMLFVTSSRRDIEPWEGRDAEMLYHRNAVLSSEEGVLSDAEATLEAGIRQSDVENGSMTVEVYPDRYDDIKAEEDEDGVVIYGDGEELVHYPGFSLAREGDSLSGPAAYQLEKRFDPGVEQE